MTTNPITSSSNTPAASNSAALGQISGIAPSEGTFLTLLVSQLKNQDPLNPTDSTQFVSELAQFSSLEQLMNINQGVSTISQVIAPGSTTTSSSSTSNGTTSNSSGSTTPASATAGIDNTLDNSLLNSIG